MGDILPQTDMFDRAVVFDQSVNKSLNISLRAKEDYLSKPHLINYFF